MQKGFLFDLNKCTGCGACQIACSLENEVPLPQKWRQVETFNSIQWPDLPFHHLSISCNHCVEAPCMKYCPALAISKNEMTGAVLIDDKKCIGCGYCSWVCPYDAPEYNQSTGIMKKCTFCQHRLEENLSPACVTLCPTTALQIENFEYEDQALKVNGFTSTDIKPALRLIELKQRGPLQDQSDLPFEKEIIELYRTNNTSRREKSKISLLGEWPLIVFTLLAPLIAGLFTAGLLSVNSNYDFSVIILGFAGIMISGTHLGKQFRAIRAILNWRQSWLSREVITYALFLLMLMIHFLVFPNSNLPGWLGVGFIYLSLYSMDQVYTLLPIRKPKKYHSAQAFLNGMFWACFFTSYMPGIVLFGIVKLYLYIKRKFNNTNSLKFYILSLTRVFIGFIAPATFWILSGPMNLHLILPFLLIGEIIDRCEFYTEMEIITPAIQMRIDLDRSMSESRRE